MPNSFYINRKRSAFLSLISLIALLPVQLFASAEQMAEASLAFLATLSAEQREQAAYDLHSDEHLRFHFVPDEIFPRNGLALKAMDANQQQLSRALLQTGLSQSGYLTASAIIELERVLKVLEPNGRFVRDNENYRISIFDTPTANGTWAWRFEGHHLSLHFQVVEGKVTVSTPSFFGSNPAHVTHGAQTEAQQDQRVLGTREDAGRALIMALSQEQLTSALLEGAAPRDIVTGADYPVNPLTPAGISAAAMTAAQQHLLLDLVTVYTGAMNADIAQLRWQKINADGFASVTFAWAGPTDIGEPHYYRVQGPSFLIEYDNVQNGANHVHSVWRDFNGDFGEDLLRQHHAEFSHD